MITKEFISQILFYQILLVLVFTAFVHYWQRLRIPKVSRFNNMFMQSEDRIYEMPLDEIAHHISDKIGCRVITQEDGRVMLLQYKRFCN